MAQNSSIEQSQWSFGAAYTPSMLWGHRSTIKDYSGYSHTASVECAKLLGGTKGWHHNYHRPRVGGALIYHSLSETADNWMLGAFSFIDIPIKRTRAFELAFRGGVGLGYNPRPWNADTKADYFFGASKLTGSLQLGFMSRIALSRRLHAQVGAMFSHFSMGNAKKPNRGHNVPGVQLGLQYIVPTNSDASQAPKLAFDRDDKRWYIQGAAGVGTREMDDFDPTRYTVSSFLLRGMWRQSPISAFGAGVDLYYSRSDFYQATKDDSSSIGFKEKASAAWMLAHELSIGKLSLQTNFGVYLYRFRKREHPFVQRLGVYYYILPQLYAGVGLKTHFGKSDYVEWTVGFRL